MEGAWKKAKLRILTLPHIATLFNQISLQPLCLPASIAPITTMHRQSSTFHLLNMFDVPRSRRDLDSLAPELPLDDLISALLQSGIILPSDQDEEAYFFSWTTRILLSRMETLANNLAGVGSGLVTAERPTAQDEALDALDDIFRRINVLEENVKRARSQHMDHQFDALGLNAEVQDLRLHLGCGAQRLPGWINIDLRLADLRMNLRWGLPFADGSTSYVYAAFVLEHFYLEEADALLREIRRVLRSGGRLRLLVPDIGACIAAYTTPDQAFFAERSRYWPWAADCATPLEHFLSYAGGSIRLADLTGHKYGYDFETLSHHLAKAGFVNITRSTLNGSADPNLNVDCGSAVWGVGDRPYALFVDAEA